MNNLHYRMSHIDILLWKKKKAGNLIGRAYIVLGVVSALLPIELYGNENLGNER